LEVPVGTVEVNRLTLLLQPVSEVSGEVRLEGAEIDRVMQSLRSLRIQLEPEDGFMTTLTAAMSSTNFVFRDVREGDYVLRFSGLPDDSYVSSIRVGGRELADKSIAVRGRLGRMEVILGSDPGQIEGSVIDAHDQPCGGARVVLIPNEPRRKRLESYKSVTTDQYGNFQFKGVMPGSYKLFVWESVEDGAWEDPEFLSTYEALGVPVEAIPETRVTQSVRMIAQTASR